MILNKEDDTQVVILYSNGCPRCKILKKKLDQKCIAYEVNDSIDDMISLGFSQVPVLKVGDELLDFVAANKWINEVV